MCVGYQLTTEGYFFSDQPFHATDTIEATQLAIMLGCETPNTAETILEARSTNDTAFRLVLKGCPQVVDQRRQPVPIETLRQLPINELSQLGLGRRGWQLQQSPYFEWLADQQPLEGGRALTIASCSSDQLNALRNLL